MIYIGKVAFVYKGTCPETVIVEPGTVSVAAQFSAPIKKVIIPEGVKYIGYGVFASDSLKEIYLPISL